jgi:hypothetical protein
MYSVNPEKAIFKISIGKLTKKIKIARSMNPTMLMVESHFIPFCKPLIAERIKLAITKPPTQPINKLDFGILNISSSPPVIE